MLRNLLLTVVFILGGFRNAELLHIAGTFSNGDVKFTWENMSQTFDKFYVTTDGIVGGLKYSYNSNYNVKDVLRYKTVTITVFESSKGLRHRFTYKVTKVECVFGQTITLSLTVKDLNESYGMYHITWKKDKIIPKPRIIMEKNKLKDYDTSKYQEIRLDENSKTTTFKIRDVTSEDAGFYVWGFNTLDALSRTGVVVIVHMKPSTPNISGNLRVEVGTFSQLTCSSELNTVPSYYSKLSKLKYSWFVNDMKLNGVTTQMLKINVTKKSGYDRYSCSASETLESNKSREVRIDPLCGPHTEGRDNLEMFDGAVIGLEGTAVFKIPVTSNPPLLPSKITWTGQDDRLIDVKSVVLQKDKDNTFSHLIISIVQVSGAADYEEYHVLYNGFSLINITINKEDLSAVLSRPSNGIDRSSSLRFLITTMLSIILGILLLSMVFLFCCSKRNITNQEKKRPNTNTPVCEKSGSDQHYGFLRSAEEHSYSTLDDTVQDHSL